MNMGTMVGREVRQAATPLPTFQRVLLCTDFSETSQAAQEAAVRLCQGRDVQLTAMHVSEYGPMAAVTDEGLDYILGLTAKEHRALQAVTVQLRNHGIQVEPVMAEGNAASIILEEIKRREIDLAIIGTEAAKGLNRFVFGSTAEAIFRRAPCPVITVRQTLSPSLQKHGRPIVFATDFDDCSLHALRYAACLAEMNRSPLHIVHVLPSTAGRGEAATLIMNEALQHLAVSLPADGTVPHCEVLFGRDVSHTVVEYAKQQDADFIAIGVRRKTTLAAHLPPHRIFRIIMTATCPVLTVACEAGPARHLEAAS
jgi:nucleotide-binding universal stress UspA family protein